MDANTILTAIGTIGFPSALAIWLFIENRRDTRKQVDDLRNDNKEDKAIFMSAIESFNKSTEEFRQVGRDLSDIKTDIKNIDKELTTIKTKIEK